MKTIVITRVPLHSQMGGEELHTLSVANYLRDQGYRVVFATKCKVLNKLAKDNGFKRLWLKDFPPSPTTKGSLLWFTLIFPFALIGSLIMYVFIRLRYGKATFYMLNLSDKILFGFWLKIFGNKAVCLEHATIGKWLTRNPFLIVLKWICRSQNVKVVTVSRRMKTELIKTLQTTVIEIRNGVKIQDEFDDSMVNPKQILFVGRLEKDKGFDIFCNIAKANPELNFVCAGTGSLDYLAENIENITLLGFVEHENLKHWYQSSRLLLLPSTTQDPFGLVVCEALSFGCPVMCSDLVNVSDYLDDSYVCKLNVFESRFREFYKQSAGLRKKAFQKSIEFDQKQMLLNYANFLNSL